MNGIVNEHSEQKPLQLLRAPTSGTHPSRSLPHRQLRKRFELPVEYIAKVIGNRGT